MKHKSNAVGIALLVTVAACFVGNSVAKDKGTGYVSTDRIKPAVDVRPRQHVNGPAPSKAPQTDRKEARK